MPKSVARHDDFFKKAAGFLMKFPTMKLPEAMKLADFTPVEQKDHAKHMAVHRLLKKTKGSNVTPPPSVVNVSTAGTVMSSENDKSSVSDITEPMYQRSNVSLRPQEWYRSNALTISRAINEQ